MPKYQLAKKLRLEIVAHHNSRCFYCGVQLDPDGTNPRTGYSIDHLNPRLEAGLNHRSNLVAACRLCNTKKKNKTLEEYRRWLYMNQAPYRAAALLAAALETSPTPFDDKVREIIDWLNARVEAVVFFGERE